MYGGHQSEFCSGSPLALLSRGTNAGPCGQAVPLSVSGGNSCGFAQLLITQQMVGSFRRREHAFDQRFVGSVVAMLLQPPDHVGFSAHRTHGDTLLLAEVRSRYAGIHAVRQPWIAFAHGFDHGGGMHARAGQESVVAKDGVVVRDGHAQMLGASAHVVAEATQVAVDPAQQFEVGEQQIHRRVAGTFADAQGRTVHFIDSGFHRGHAVREVQIAIAVSVPVDADISALALHNAFHERHEIAHTVWRRVAARVANADALGAEVNREAVKRFNVVGMRARRVFGDKHHWDLVIARVAQTFFDMPEERVERPVFGVLADRRATDEAAGQHRESRGVHDGAYRLDVSHYRAAGHIGADGELVLGDVLRHREDVFAVGFPRAWQPEIGGFDPDRCHAVQDFELCRHWRIEHRGRLQPVAQRFIVKRDGLGGLECAALKVPVVDEFVLCEIHGSCPEIGRAL